jgi:hypothetical protein
MGHAFYLFLYFYAINLKRRQYLRLRDKLYT